MKKILALVLIIGLLSSFTFARSSFSINRSSSFVSSSFTRSYSRPSSSWSSFSSKSISAPSKSSSFSSSKTTSSIKTITKPKVTTVKSVPLKTSSEKKLVNNDGTNYTSINHSSYIQSQPFYHNRWFYMWLFNNNDIKNTTTVNTNQPSVSGAITTGVSSTIKTSTTSTSLRDRIIDWFF